MRNMSFSMTTAQVRNRTKTVTRRFGWWNLKPGDVLCAIEKGQGLKKGEKVVRICQIEVVKSTAETLSIMELSPGEAALEGFPDSSEEEFVTMLCKKYKKSRHDLVNRIEFKYL